MNYQDYINLGFKRHELNCAVEMKENGYGGYSLEKKLKNGYLVCVCYGELDKPKMYIPKNGADETYHFIPISIECVADICNNEKTYNVKK